jgi:hypothetical protein
MHALHGPLRGMLTVSVVISQALIFFTQKWKKLKIMLDILIAMMYIIININHQRPAGAHPAKGGGKSWNMKSESKALGKFMDG